MGIVYAGFENGMGILSGTGRRQERLVALDLHLAAVEYRVVAQAGVEADVPASSCGVPICPGCPTSWFRPGMGTSSFQSIQQIPPIL